jgi:hypothetical protein
MIYVMEPLRALQHHASMPDDFDDLGECARALVKRHGASASSVAKVFADAHAKIGNAEMTAFWNAVTEEIRKVAAPVLH